jgi:hypothetical protein
MHYRFATDAYVARREAPACLRKEARATSLRFSARHPPRLAERNLGEKFPHAWVLVIARLDRAIQ